MAADHVVGEDFQLRLIVGFRFVRQQQRPRHHLGVGLLRVRLDHDLALEHAVALAVEHGAELLAALAGDAGVLDQQRVVDMLLVAQETDAADACLRSLAGETHEGLIAHQRGVGGEGEGVERRARANIGQQARHVQAARLRDLDVIDLRLVADDHFDRRIHLRVAAVVVLDDDRLGALLGHDQRPHESR